MRRIGKILLALCLAVTLCFVQVVPAFAAGSTSAYATAAKSVVLSIKSQPKNTTVKLGASAKFTVVAVGTGLKYRWQYSDNGGTTWENSSIKKSSYTTTATAGRHGRMLRCVVTNAAGKKVTSKAATLLISGRLSIKGHPTDVTVKSGETAKLTVVAAGTGLKYRWQYSDNGGATWNNSSIKKSSYTTTATAGRHGRMLRCVVTDKKGNSVTSKEAMIIVSGQLKVKGQPKNATVKLGASAKFTVVAAGTGLKYQWQFSDNGGTTWYNSSIKKSSYTTTATAGRHGRMLRCVVTDTKGKQVVSNTASLLISGRLTFKIQPEDITAKLGATAKLTVVAAGEGLKYRWQYSDDVGVTWKNSSVTKNAYAVKVTSAHHARMVRCVVTDAKGSVIISNEAMILVQGLIKIKKQPQNDMVELGAKARYSVTAFGDGLRYQWQYSDNGGGKWNNGSGTNSIYATTATAGRHGRMLRCVIVDSHGNKAVSDEAMILVDGMLNIKKHPQDTTSDIGKIATFTVVAAGADMTYQWQYSDDEGENWINSAGKGATYTAKVDSTHHCRLVRCIVNDAHGNMIVSDSAGLLVNGVVKIKKQPQDITALVGEVVKFSVEAVGVDVAYLWQYSDDEGENWENSTATADTCLVGTASVPRGRLYRCVITSGNGRKTVSDVARLSISNPIKIKDQPQNVTTSLGTTARFSVAAAGNGLTYQWQCSDDEGETWGNSATVTSSYATTATAVRHGRLLRCVVTDIDGNTVVSRAARLLIRDLINITEHPADVTAVDGTVARFAVAAVGNELRYRWQYSDDKGESWINSTAKTGSYTTRVTPARHGRLIRCVITDGVGNTLVSETATLRVDGLLKIIEQPQDVMCAVGDRVQLHTLTDAQTAYYQWQYSEDGYQWIDMSSVDSTCVFTVTAESFGRLYRCVVRDGYGNSCTTDTVELIDENNLILVQPQDWIGCVDGQIFFEVVASADVVSYRWEISSNNGRTWNSSKVDGAYYQSTATSEKNNWSYRCIVTDADGNEQISDTVCVTITNTFSITKQPVDAMGEIGQRMSFLIQAGGSNVTFTWQSSADGVYWTYESNNGHRLNRDITPTTVGKYYRCIVRNGNGAELVSDTVRLTWEQTGFFTYNGKVYYVKEDGHLAVGLETIEGDLYYFTSGGMTTAKMLQFGEDIYYFTDDGAAALGFVYVPDKFGTYYFQTDHTAAVGWKEIEGETYYFYDFGSHIGIMARGVTQIGTGEYFFDHDTGVQTYGMVQVGFNTYMYFVRGQHRPYVGLKEENGALYYFSESETSYGVSLEEKHTINGKVYHFDAQTKQALTGFITYKEDVYYLGADYAVVKGALVNDATETYLFNRSGIMQYGLVDFDGNCYYFDEQTGAAVDGWVDIDGEILYFDPCTHAAVKGLVNIDGVNYCFSDRGYLNIGVSVIDGVRYYSAPKGEQQSGFIEINKNIYYVREDQTLATGLTLLNGKLYYFDPAGIMQYGFYIIDAVRYYFDLDTGAAVTGTVQLSNGNTYGFNGISGASSGLTKINGALYHLNRNGIVQYGRVESDGRIYYFDPSSGRAVSGWQSIRCGDNVVRKAYFDPKSYCAVIGAQKIDGSLYYFSQSGWAQTGNRVVGTKTYYFSKSAYAAYTGSSKPKRFDVWGTIDGVKCFYGTDGKPVKGLQTIDGKLYYFTQDGKMYSGFKRVNGNDYYFGKNGAQCGHITINGKAYYFSPSSLAMLTGMHKIDGAFGYYHEDGTKKTGWVTIQNGDRFYMTATGAQTGLAEINGKTYFFGNDGVMRVGVQAVKAEDGKQITCLFGQDGVMITGLVSMNGAWYFYDTQTGARAVGFKQIDGKEYYFYRNTGKAVTGMRNIGGVYCYFDTTTAQRQYGFQWVDGRLYYFTNDTSQGGLARGLTKINGKNYYFSVSGGAAKTGYYSINDVKYYFDPKTGAAISTIYRRNNGHVYSFKAEGGLNTGWITFEGKSYFFYPSTGRMAEGLASVDDKLYYFDFENGKICNSTVVVGGITYRLDKNGYASAVGDANIVTLINTGIANLDKKYGDEGGAQDADCFTCSQFVSHLLESIDIDIVAGVYRQYYAVFNSDYGCTVVSDLEHAKAGDLIYFTIVNCPKGDACNYWNEIHHVGIYLGDGKIMDSTRIEGDKINEGPMVRDVVDSSNVLIYKMLRINGVNDP